MGDERERARHGLEGLLSHIIHLGQKEILSHASKRTALESHSSHITRRTPRELSFSLKVFIFDFILSHPS